MISSTPAWKTSAPRASHWPATANGSVDSVDQAGVPGGGVLLADGTIAVEGLLLMMLVALLLGLGLVTLRRTWRDRQGDRAWRPALDRPSRLPGRSTLSDVE